MSEISFEHFLDGYSLCNHEKVIDKIISVFKKTIAKTETARKKTAEIYMNGGSYYLQSLNDDLVGFGSGCLDIVFHRMDSEAIVRQKLQEYFSSRYTTEIAWGGFQFVEEKPCLWRDDGFAISRYEEVMQSYLEQSAGRGC